MENQCFGFHNCLHCDKTHNILDKGWKIKKVEKSTHYDYMNYWKWNQVVKKLHESYI